MREYRNPLTATAVAKARQEGLQSLVKEAPKWAVATAATSAELATRRRLRQLCYRCQGFRAIPAPTATIDIDPATVTRLVPFSHFDESDPRALLGTIRDGEWDRNLPRIADQPKYEACRARVEDGVSWAETGIIDHLAQTLEEENSIEHGCSSRDELLERYETERETLYQSLAREGYNRALSPVCCQVHIGRDGELLFGEGGRHRFYLSRILGIESVPVQVLCRHEQWQVIRDTVIETGNRDSLPDEIKGYLDHPDLQALESTITSSVMEPDLAEAR